MHRFGRRVGLVPLEDPEDALALGRHLATGGAEELGQFFGRLHARHLITNHCFSTIVVEHRRASLSAAGQRERDVRRVAGSADAGDRLSGRPLAGGIRPGIGPGPAVRPGLRRAGHRRWHHRGGGGARRRQPRPQNGAGGEETIRLGNLVRVVQAGPREACATCSSTSTGWSTRTWPNGNVSWTTRPPGLTPPFPHPPVRKGGGGQCQAWPASTRTALWLYDLTGGMRIGHRHEKVDPGLRPSPTCPPCAPTGWWRDSCTGMPAPTTPGSR